MHCMILELNKFAFTLKKKKKLTNFLLFFSHLQTAGYDVHFQIVWSHDKSMHSGLAVSTYPTQPYHHITGEQSDVVRQSPAQDLCSERKYNFVFASEGISHHIYLT